MLAAGAKAGVDSRQALAELCRLYWYPAYGFVRRGGRSPEDATELTQEFLTRLIERNDFSRVDPEKGRFRSWLLGALKHFLANEWDRETAAKRDRRREVPLEATDAEDRYLREPSHDIDPEKLYHRRWAMLLLERVLGRLREECVRDGREALFEKVKGLLVGPEGEDPVYRPIAEALGVPVDGFKVTVFRLRQRFGKLIREEIAETVERPEDIEDEIDFLLAALSVPEP